MCTSPVTVTLTLLTLARILNLPLPMDLILTLDSLLDPASTRIPEVTGLFPPTVLS